MEKEVCSICFHGISNPICTNCYIRHARSWLADMGLRKEEVEKAIRKIKENLPTESLNEHECVICHKDVVSICAYCAFLKTSKIILKLNANKSQIESFIDSSNFQHED